MSIYILDTETTDKKDGEVIELAAMKVTFNQNTCNFIYAKNYFHKYYKPVGNISYGAMAIHHIIPEDLEDMPVFSYDNDIILPDLEYMIGHNIKFDWEAIGKPNCRLIDTLVLARQAWPEIDSYTQSALMYYLSDDKEKTREELKNAHSAIDDISFCFEILQSAVEVLLTKGVDTSPEGLWRYCEEMKIPVLMPVGKYKETPIAELPMDYVDWFLRQSDIEENLKLALLDRKYPGTIRKYLEQLA